jgi:molybdopterin converting factor small subunit
MLKISQMNPAAAGIPRSAIERKEKMKVTVKCFATLAETDSCDYRDSTPYELSAGADVKELMRRLKVAEDQVKLVFINGKKAEASARLADGDQVGLFPPVGGM